MAEKPVKLKTPEKEKPENRSLETAKAKQPEKPKAALAKAPEKDKEKSQPRQPNRIVRWYRETMGELRKVTWPTPQEARRMTVIVLIVMVTVGIFLGLLDFIFSNLVGLLIRI